MLSLSSAHSLFEGLSYNSTCRDRLNETIRRSFSMTHTHMHTTSFNVYKQLSLFSMSAVYTKWLSSRLATHTRQTCKHAYPAISLALSHFLYVSLPLFTLRRIWQRHLNDTAIMVKPSWASPPPQRHAAAAATNYTSISSSSSTFFSSSSSLSNWVTDELLKRNKSSSRGSVNERERDREGALQMWSSSIKWGRGGGREAAKGGGGGRVCADGKMKRRWRDNDGEDEGGCWIPQLDGGVKETSKWRKINRSKMKGWTWGINERKEEGSVRRRKKERMEGREQRGGEELI